MKKRTIAKTGATMLTMAMLLNGTTVFAAAGTNYGATIEGKKQLLFDKYHGYGHTGKRSECNIYICSNSR